MKTNNFDFDTAFDDIFTQRSEVSHSRFASNIAFFREKFEKLQKLVDMYKVDRDLCKEFSDSSYSIISRLAFQAGISNKDNAPLTADQVSTYMNKVRIEKGLVKTRKVLPPANPVAAIREQLGGRPSGVLPSRSVTPRPDAVAISQPKNVVNPPAQPASFNFQNAMRRLVSEQKNQFKGVQLVDEDVWFLNTVVEQEWKELKQFGHYGKKFWDVIEIAKWSENSVRYALTALKAKLIHLNVFDDYKNID